MINCSLASSPKSHYHKKIMTAKSYLPHDISIAVAPQIIMILSNSQSTGIPDFIFDQI